MVSANHVAGNLLLNRWWAEPTLRPERRQEPFAMWTPYEVQSGRRPDFRVRYRFYSADEGGREAPRWQGYRSDLSYEGDDLKTEGMYMVWPEFLDEHGEVILDNRNPVPPQGEAYMWILNDEMRELHRRKATLGAKCFFMEGSRRVAEPEVIERIAIEET
jgi:hypothetical protein